MPRRRRRRQAGIRRANPFRHIQIFHNNHVGQQRLDQRLKPRIAHPHHVQRASSRAVVLDDRGLNGEIRHRHTRVLQLAVQQRPGRRPVVHQNRLHLAVERRFDRGAVGRFDFENLAERLPPIRCGEELPQDFEPRAFLGKLQRCRLQGGGDFRQLPTGFGCRVGGRRQRGAAGLRRRRQRLQTLLKLFQPLRHRAALVFELEFFGG